MTSSESSYYLTDGLGSTMATVDSDGDVVNEYTYDVFGATRSESGAQDNEFQFAGQQVDGSTGLQYLRARYYDMETGRFISRDPILVEPGVVTSPYAYASGNPVNLTDPAGLCSLWVRIFDPTGYVNCVLEDVVGGLNEAEREYCVGHGLDRAQKCYDAHNAADEAVIAVTSVYGNRDDDVTAAFRHCLWSGFMACKFRSGQAKLFGDLHEDYAENENSDRQLALHNNRVGRLIGEYYRGRPNATKFIASECLRAVHDGRLFTDRHLFDEGAWDAVGTVGGGA